MATKKIALGTTVIEIMEGCDESGLQGFYIKASYEEAMLFTDSVTELETAVRLMTEGKELSDIINLLGMPRKKDA